MAENDTPGCPTIDDRATDGTSLPPKSVVFDEVHDCRLTRLERLRGALSLLLRGRVPGRPDLYRWWTVRAWRPTSWVMRLADQEGYCPGYGVKLGPVSVFAYRYGSVVRYSFAVLCGPEHVLMVTQ